MLLTVLMIFHTLVAAALVFMVLQEMKKFQELGGAFGSGMSSTMFGRQKGLDTSGKITVLLAVIFFASCFLSSYFLSR